MDAGFLAELPPAAAAHFREVGSTRTYEARSYLIHEGDDSNHVLFVESGLLRIDHTTSGGRTVLFDLAMPGDLVGELSAIDGLPRSAGVAAVTESQVLAVGATTFGELLAEEPGFQAAVLARVVRRMRILSDQLVETTTQCASSRIAARLVSLAAMHGTVIVDYLDGSGRFDIRLPITQEELGQWAGLSREGVVKGISELRDAGLIETGRRRVRVMDAPALERAASKAW